MHDDLDSVIHPPKRLRICAMLYPVSEVEFAVIRDELEVSDSVLSKQIRYLEDASYVKVRKVTTKSRRRTWISLTDKGRKVFDRHITALKVIAESSTGKMQV